MAAGGVATGIRTQREKAFMSALPDWTDPDQTVISESAGFVRVTVRCRCSEHNKVQGVQRVGRGKEPATISQKLGPALQRLHDQRHPDCPAAQPGYTPAPPEERPAREDQLQLELSRQKRKKRAADGKLEVLQAKVDKAASALAEHTELARQNSRAEKRRKAIDPEDKAEFTRANKSTAMTAGGSGIIDTIKYWCDGSEPKVLQLVLAQIREFKL